MMTAQSIVYCTSVLPLGVCLYRYPVVCTLHTKMLIKIDLAQYLFSFFLSLSFVFPTFFLVMSCGMPVPPVNGSIVGQDFSLGARATYQCNPGFRLAGPVTSSVICQESARWSPIEAPPRCVREYSSLPLLAEPTASWVLKTTLATRRKIYPAKFDGKMEPNSGCSPSDFSAVTCPDIGHSAVEHGRWRLIYGTQNQYDAIMMLICDPGYYYRGQRVIRCQANSTWNYPDPRPVCDSKYKQTIQWFHFSNIRTRLDRC